MTTRTIHGVPPCKLALAWRKHDGNPLVLTYADAARVVHAAHRQ